MNSHTLKTVRQPSTNVPLPNASDLFLEVLLLLLVLRYIFGNFV